MATDTDSPSDTPYANRPATSNAPTGRARPEEALIARVETYDDAPDECTIYPVDAGPTTRPTTWVSAEAGSFVALDEMR